MPTIIIDHRKKSQQLSFNDNPNASEILKIGREINRYKQKDGHNAKEIDRRFGQDANKLMKSKQDSTLAREIREDFKRGLAREGIRI